MSGYPCSINDAISFSKRGARIVIVTLFSHEITTQLNPLVLQEKEIVGSVAYTKSDFKTVMTLMLKDRIKPKVLATHKLPLEKAAEALNILHKRTEPVIKIILKP